MSWNTNNFWKNNPSPFVFFYFHHCVSPWLKTKCQILYFCVYIFVVLTIQKEKRPGCLFFFGIVTKTKNQTKKFSIWFLVTSWSNNFLVWKVMIECQKGYTYFGMSKFVLPRLNCQEANLITYYLVLSVFILNLTGFFLSTYMFLGKTVSAVLMLGHLISFCCTVLQSCDNKTEVLTHHFNQSKNNTINESSEVCYDW